MSALGQKETWTAQTMMSAFVQRYRQQLFASTPMVFTAVERRRIERSSLKEKRSKLWRDAAGSYERLGGLEIDHQLEFRGLLNRKIAGLRALENLVHVLGNTLLHG
jgi:hypothetical protein